MLLHVLHWNIDHLESNTNTLLRDMSEAWFYIKFIIYLLWNHASRDYLGKCVKLNNLFCLPHVKWEMFQWNKWL